MTPPLLKVEVAFDDGPFELSPTWTDITEFVLGDDGDRGRTYELDKVQTGTRTVVLANNDGKFTPERVGVGSPFEGNIDARKQVRVTYVQGDTVWGRFRGYTDTWVTSSSGGEDAICTLTCVDGFDWLSDLPLSTPYRARVLLDEPLAYWPLTCPDGSAELLANLGNVSVRREGPLQTEGFQSTISDDDWHPEDLLIASQYPAVEGDGSFVSLQFGNYTVSHSQSGCFARTLDTNELGFAQEPFQGITNTPAYTLEVWLSANHVAVADEVYLAQLNADQTAPAFLIGSNADGDVVMRWYTADDGSSFVEHVFTSDTSDAVTGVRNANASGIGGWHFQRHHIAVTHASLSRGSWGPQLVYLDGALVATVDLTGDHCPLATYHYVGGILAGLPSSPTAMGDFNFAYESVIGHYAIYNRVLDADTIADHHRCGQFSTELSATYDARLNTILDYAKWPASWRDIDTDTSGELVTQMQWDQGSKALDELQATETDSGGVVFVNTGGEVAFRTRLARVGGSSVATFTVDSSSAPEAPLEWSRDRTHLCNYIIATREDYASTGIVTTIINQASIDKYGEFHDDNFELHLGLDEWVVQRAYDKLQRYATPDVRISKLVLKPSAGADDADFWGDVLSLEIGDQITLDNLPDHAPASTISYFIESVNDSWTLDGETSEPVFTFDLSPGDIWIDWVDPPVVTPPVTDPPVDPDGSGIIPTDLRSDAPIIDVFGGSVTYDASSYTNSVESPFEGLGGSDANGTSWVEWICGSSGGTASFDAIGDLGAALMTVFDDTGTIVAISSGFSAHVTPVTFTAVAGTTYWIKTSWSAPGDTAAVFTWSVPSLP